MKFLYLSLNDLLLGVADLVEVRLLKVTHVASVSMYAPRLQARLAEIRALPGAGTGAEPFAEELAAKDVEHDGHGGAIWFLVEAFLRSPLTSPELRDTLLDVRARFVPELAELKRPHADEAAAAIKREPDLDAMAKSLRALRLPGGASLYDWVAAFLSAGKDLNKLLKDRADAVSGDRSGAGPLRATTLGQLNRFRAAIDDEFEDDAEKRDSVDRALFAYLDELEKRRTPSANAAPAQPTPSPPADPTKPA